MATGSRPAHPFAAVELDPLHAAVDDVFAAAISFGDAYPQLLRELRDTFPTVGGASDVP